jgi:GTPase SAR1 family protein
VVYKQRPGKILMMGKTRSGKTSFLKSICEETEDYEN